MHRLAALVEDGDLDPRVVRPEPGGPDDDVDLHGVAVGALDAAAARLDRAAEKLDAVPARELPVARADQEVAASLRAAEAADRRADDSEVIAPPVQALAEDAAREPRRLRAHRQPHPPCGRELLRDLDAGVRSAHDERVAGRQLVRALVLGAVELG